MPRYILTCETEIDVENLLQADELLTVIWARLLMALMVLEINWSNARMTITRE